jgi:uncharacterized protein YecA (UPF0149 family)
MEENAENECKTFLEKSLEYDDKNAETLQLFASYWISKENTSEAHDKIIESFNIWMPKYLKLAEESTTGGAGISDLIDMSQACILTYDSRINTSRILTEVQEYDKAIQVLEQLVDEDDEVVVVFKNKNKKPLIKLNLKSQF